MAGGRSLLARLPVKHRLMTSPRSNPFNLSRFVNAQNPVYRNMRAELRHGRKEGHWIWFIFPQLQGLGHSAMATAFGISSRQEAVAYLDHPVLGPRLRESLV